MLGRDYPGQNCSVARTLEIVGERWTLLILRDAFLGLTRFERFGRKLGVAPNILAKRLDTLVEAGIMERRAYQEHPVRHEYVLTERGRGLFPVIAALLRWGDANAAPHGAPVRALHTGCGGELTQRARCDACGSDLGPEDVEWHWGPGSGRPEGPIRAGARAPVTERAG